MSKTKQKSQVDLDWENRTLCIDENCIGVVGPDGRCKECGKPHDGFKPPTSEDETIESTSSEVEKVVEVEDVEDVDSIDPEFNDAWENRTLCVDESCIGVIGPDGRCKECGKPYKTDS